MSSHPTDIVTFLFTYIEGSTKLAQEHPDRWKDLHTILKAAPEGIAATFSKSSGCILCAFHATNNGLNAAIEAQCTLNSIKITGIPSRRSDRIPFAKIKPRQGWKNT